MPEQPDPKHPLPRHPPTTIARPTVPYAELHCRTNFTFLEGASHPHELVERATELGYTALAITDRESVAGVVRAHVAAKETKLKLLIGSAVHPIDGPAMLVWAINRKGYSRLTRLLTLGRQAAPKGECRLTFADVAGHADGLLAGVLLHAATRDQIEMARDVFGDRCYGVAEVNRGSLDALRLEQLARLGRAGRVPLVAANDVHYHVPRRRPLHDVLTAIRHGCTVADLGDRRFTNGERHLKSPEEMLTLFAAYPDAVPRTAEVADRCTFILDELRYDYPEELCPGGLTPLANLTVLTWDGANERYPNGIPDKVRGLIDHELELIAELRYEAYFLTVSDLVKFARSRNILCQGRGSAANSVVCFCLGVTSVSPEQVDVLFERFISKDRGEAPDIDIDFEHERREEVLQYLYDKYGRERAGMTAEVISYRERSAVRDVGKALGLSQDRLDGLAKTMDHHPARDEDRLASRLTEGGLDPDSRLAKQLVWLVGELLGFPRHLSQHVGGMVMTNGPLCELVPIENAAMAARTVVQWDKDDLDALGILKVDCLALGMLTAIRKCFDLVEKHHGHKWILATIPADDPVVYEMCCRADTVGVFQIESRAQMSMLPRLRPKKFYDLVIEVAIVRPGPIQGGMVHPYLRRRQEKEPVSYPRKEVEEVLHKTLGVPIFQEQAMKLAVVAAGFTPGEADQLRRAMGAWRKTGVMNKFKDKLLNGMAANNYPPDFAEAVYKQICGFGEYGFPESHAASFALLVYVSAWLKCHHPAAFCAALLNSQPMGFYGPSQLVGDAKRHGVEARPIDVNHSDWDCTLESTRLAATPSVSLRLGFRLISGLSQIHADAIVAARRDGPFRTFTEFVHRTGLRAGALKQLAQADAFGSLALDRQSTLWRSLPERGPLMVYDRFASDEEPANLPTLEPMEEVLADYKAAGLTLRQHPISFLRPMLDEMKIVQADRLAVMANDVNLAVAGIVMLRQRPSTAKGVTFVTLEDETGTVNLIVHKDVWERYRRVARLAVAMIAHGKLQIEKEVIHVLVTRMEDLSEKLAALSVKSRDFH
ncbi:MAG TPA: error-prone DNA polymerase [Gemmataceae bacterium]|jgi:error-prone DNA polymerase|nr:error-prone DNA polymerase [Gemmataceae bacterium]